MYPSFRAALQHQTIIETVQLQKSFGIRCLCRSLLCEQQWLSVVFVLIRGTCDGGVFSNIFTVYSFGLEPVLDQVQEHNILRSYLLLDLQNIEEPCRKLHLCFDANNKFADFSKCGSEIQVKMLLVTFCTLFSRS